MRSPLLIKLTAPTVVLSLLMLVLGGTGAWYVWRLQRQSLDELHTAMDKLNSAEELAVAGQGVQYHISMFLRTRDKNHVIHAHRFSTEIRPLHRAIQELSNSENEQALLGDIARSESLVVQRLDIIRKTDGEVSSGTIVVMQSLERQTSDHLVQPAREYIELTLEKIMQQRVRDRELSNWMAWLLLVTGIVGCGAGLLAGYGVTRSVRHSMAQLSLPIHDAAGHLDSVIGPIEIDSCGDFQDMEEVLHTLSDRIGEVVQHLHDTQKAAARADQLAAVGQMAAGVAHELRNPLASMKILVQSATEKGDSALLSGQDLHILDDEITRLDHIIQTFLDYARPPKLEKRFFDLREVISQTVDFLSARADVQNVFLDFRPEPLDAGFEIDADPGQLRQVIMNLVVNGLDVLPQGGDITITLARTTAGESSEGKTGNWFEIRVADTGTGLDPEFKHRIFEPFVSTKQTGTGLGLAICRRIIEEHDGTLTAADGTDGGTVFTVRLPFEPVGKYGPA